MQSTLDNHSIGQIVDDLGAIKAQMADLKVREDALKAELIARNISEAEGALFRATISKSMRWVLDTARIKVEMGAAWYDLRCRVGTVSAVHVSARKGLSATA